MVEEVSDTWAWPFCVKRRDGSPSVQRVHDVNRVVLAVRAGDAEKETEPSPEPELPLLSELGLEDERPA